jgi:hypothetical protein
LPLAAAGVNIAGMSEEQLPSELFAKALAAFTSKGDNFEGYIMSRLRLANIDELQQLSEAAKVHDFKSFDVEFLRACVMVQVDEEVKRRLHDMQSGLVSPQDAINPPQTGVGYPPTLPPRPRSSEQPPDASPPNMTR